MNSKESFGVQWTPKLETEYASLFFNEELKLAICIAHSEYIPIENFKAIFQQASELISKTKITSFIFDKSNLRTFHQPSMEWYFAIWKPLMREKGLIHHYKILPKLDWFVKAVEAGKWEIFQKYGKEIIAGIEIVYVDSVEEVIQKLQNV